MRRILASVLTVWAAAAIVIPPDRAAGEDFAIEPGKPNLVTFQSKATLETFEGKTRQVSGAVRVTLGNLEDSVDVLVDVDLASLDTGIGVRNKHMREEHLETARYPKAEFHGVKLLDPSSPSIAPGEKVSCTIAGDLSLHGVTKPVEIPVVVSMPSNTARISMHVVGRFDVKLADYGIARPAFLMMRLDETQHVAVDIVAFRKGD
jgi:polyisoprenoid-binding protein YceI